MKEYKQVNYKLPAEIVDELKKRAEAEKMTATELVLRGLRHVLGLPEQQLDQTNSAIQESIRFIEERLRQIEDRDIENQLYPRLARLEMLISTDENNDLYENLDKRIEKLEGKDSNIDGNIEAELNRLGGQIERLDKILIRTTIEIQSTEQRLFQRLTALEKRLKSLEEPQNKAEQLEAVFEKEAPLIKLIKNPSERESLEDKTSESHISSEVDNKTESSLKSDSLKQESLVEENLTHSELADRTGMNIGNIRARYARNKEVFHNGITYIPKENKGKPRWISQNKRYSPQLLTDPKENKTSNKSKEENEKQKTHEQIAELTGMNIEAVRTRHRFDRPIQWNTSTFIPIRLEGKPRWIEQTKE